MYQQLKIRFHGAYPCVHLLILLVPRFVIHSSISLWQAQIVLTGKSNKNKVFNVFVAIFNML